MRVAKIELNNTAQVVQVELNGSSPVNYVRQFAAATLHPRQIQEFIEECEEAEGNVRNCRIAYMLGGNILPFVQRGGPVDGNGGSNTAPTVN